jgi:hypothetical protein
MISFCLMMKITSAILGMAVALSQPLASAAVVYVAPREPPPEAVVERPAPRSGYVWVNGHHVWRGRRYEWHHGHYVHERRGYGWHDGGWEHRGDRYEYRRGGWRR